MHRLLPLFLLLIFSLHAFAGKLESAFEALSIYDYFKAKKLFVEELQKRTTGASYGLSLIYINDKNPFYHLDSAFRYVMMAEERWKVENEKEKMVLIPLGVSPAAIDSLKKIIYKRAYKKAEDANSIEAFEYFMKNFRGAPQMADAFENRDELAWMAATQDDTWQGYKKYIEAYPVASQVKKAKNLYELRLFETFAEGNTISSYEKFLQQYPNSSYAIAAEDSIYKLSTPVSTVLSYYNFIKKHTSNHNVNDAWKNMYALFVKDSDAQTIEAFIKEYPDFPFKDLVIRDLTLTTKLFLPVRFGKKWGYVDTDGKQVIKNNFDRAEAFTDGIAEIVIDDKIGFIDKTGEIIIEPKFDEVEKFKNGFAVVAIGDYYGIINKLGHAVIPVEYDEVSNYYDGAALIGKNDKFGFADETGKIIIPLQYDDAGDFNDGIASFEIDGKSGFIDKTGKIIIEPEYDWTESFKNGRARVRKDDYFCVIDRNGNYVLPCHYDQIGEISEGFYQVLRNDKFGFADSTGKTIVPLDFDYTEASPVWVGMKNGFARFDKREKAGLVDNTGRVVIPAEFDDIYSFSQGLAAAAKKGKWGFIDMNKKIIVPFSFDYTWSFCDSLAKVKKAGKFGFINHSGVVVVPIEYDETVVENNLIIVTKNGKKGLLTMENKVLLQPQYDIINLYSENIYRVFKNNRLAYFNSQIEKFIWLEEDFEIASN